MASLGGEQQISTNNSAAEATNRPESREGSVERKAAKERDDKLKVARERQNEERQRKIEELKAQAEAAQRYREQKEEERRRRIDEIRQRDSEKRTQVEDRKKAIMEAEKERREYILRKNIALQERDSRIEVKKRERNSIGYAFGSSTPRLLESSDFGMISPSQFWGQRRSTSISNVAGATLSRRSSERELNDSGSKKRATSASGTDRHEEDHVDTSHIVFRSVARRKTDLMPTIPSPRDGHHYGSRSSLSHTPSRTPGRAYSMNRLDQLAQPIRRNGEHIRAIMERQRAEQLEMMEETESLGGGRRSTKKSSSGSNSKMSRSMIHLAGEGPQRPKYNLGSRSGTVTPGGHMNSSRPGSAMSTSTTMSTSGFINRRSVPAARKPRPASIAGTGVSLEEINKLKKENKPPVKTSSLSPSMSAQTTPKRSTNLMSTSLIVTSSSSRLFSAEKKTPIKREPLTPKAPAPKPLSKTSSSDRLHKLSKEKSKDILTKSAIIPPVANRTTSSTTTAKEPTKSKEEKEALNQVKTEEAIKPPQQNGAEDMQKNNTQSAGAETVPEPVTSTQEDEKTDEGTEKEVTATEPETVVVAPTPKPKSRNGSKEGSMVRELAASTTDNNDAMTASMIAKGKITTEEEAKAALAERRRLAREEAERQAELERQRVEAERLAELKRQEEEAERQRMFEEEAMRMAAEQRKAEEERLLQAIKETKQREEEEKLKREDEEKQRVEREEAEKKAKEEAEKQRIEVAERLKREEKEREERRKRVEAIMSRTRRAGANTTPNSTPTKENNNSPKPAEETPVTPSAATTADAQSEEATPNSNNITITTATTTITNDDSNSTTTVINNGSDSVSTSGSSSTEATTPPTPASQPSQETEQQAQPIVIPEPQNTQAMYEQSVLDKENSLINSFSNMIIDENVKNIQQNLQQQQQLHSQIVVEETNGKLFTELQKNDSNITTITPTSVANGNGHHIESINNKNDIDLLQTVVPSTNQLIDLSLDSQDNNVNFNNNNSLLTTTTTTLVTADSHENKDISLL